MQNIRFNRKEGIFLDMLELSVIVALSILLVIAILYYTKGKMRFAKLLFGMCSGVVLLFPVQYLLTYLGYGISVNIFTIAISAILGVPGVALISALCLV